VATRTTNDTGEIGSQRFTTERSGLYWTFRRRCAVAGLAFLLLSQFGKLIYYDTRHVRDFKDFPQYFMAGLIARTGAWDSLYPIPRTGSETNPGAVENSTMRPRYEELARATGVGDAARFMQPPPVALLLIPLSWMSLYTSFYVWTLLLTLAAWGIGLQAATMYELCVDQPVHRAGGFLILLVCLSPQAHRWVRSANMSVLIGWLIGAATIALVRRNNLLGGLSVALGALAKYALLVLGPLQLAMRRWRTILVETLVVSLLLAATVIAAGSLEPYRTFGREILPTLSRTASVAHDQALYPTILRILHLNTMPPTGAVTFEIGQWTVLSIILLLIAMTPRRTWDSPSAAMSAVLALTAWLLVFSPICWEHYFAYLAPFWGFLAYQARRSIGRCVAAFLAIALSYLPTDLIQSFKLPEPLFSHLCISAVLTMFFATWILWRHRMTGDLVRLQSPPISP
jgi:hypothetical protein